ncbi:UNVERIFIED_CONTAM: hypothetical protein H355_015243 [Colinus virginianus]|nr:hypothetical protein H355_015243 [Colinus virginianus]
MAVAVLVAVLLAVAVVAWVSFPPRAPRCPPCIGSRVPWLGAALRFGRAPLEFIGRARDQHGPVFTVFTMGKRFTFVMEEEGAEVFFTSKDLNFEQAVQQLVENAGVIGLRCKEALTNDNFQNLRVMYPAVVNTLFGKGICPTSQRELREFQEHFWKYDEDFEYASQMPECFLRNWSKSKKWLLKLFEKVVSDAEGTNSSETTSKTLLQHLVDNLQGKHLAPNYGLLMLWASQANTVPTAFWTLVFILSYPSVYKKIMEDLTSVFGSAGKDEIEVSEEDLKNLPYIKWCTLEAIRLRSPGAIIKKVIKPVRIQDFTIPAGDMLVLSPYWLHRNPNYFPDPEMFKPVVCYPGNPVVRCAVLVQI